MSNLKIESFDDLFFYYNELHNKRVDGKAIEIALDDFLENFEFILTYKDNLNRLKGTVDNCLAEAIIDLQEFIYDLYKVVKHQDNPYVLSNSELNALKIYVKISDGSTKELIKNTRQLLETMVADMSATQKMIVIAMLSMVLTAGWVGTHYIDYLESTKKSELEIEAKKLENQKEADRLIAENERTEMIIQGMRQVNQEIATRPIYKEVIKSGQKAILKPIRQDNGYTLVPSDNLGKDKTTIKASYVIDETKAKAILKSTRTASETNIVEDTFNIKYIEAMDDRTKYKIKVYSTTSDINGIVEISINDKAIDFDAISRHLSSRQAIKLRVKTKTLKNNTSVEDVLATV